MAYFNRYQVLEVENEVGFFPDIQLDNKETDKFEIYEAGKSRFDKFSDKHYGEPWWGFLINMANPELTGLEFTIPHGTAIRIPFPLNETVKELKDKMALKKRFYGD